MKKCLSAILLLTTIQLSAADFTSVNVENFIRETWNPSTVIVDVRTESEYTEGHLAGALLIDFKQTDFMQQVSDKLPKDKRLAVYCRSGKRSKQAALQLAEAGYVVTELDGGILAWQEAKKKVVKGSKAELERYEEHLFQVNKQFAVKYRDVQVGEEEPTQLIIYLHSSSACGIDNELPVRQPTFKQLMRYAEEANLSARILVPQCRVDRRWNEYRPMQGCMMSEALFALIKDYQKQYGLQEVYILGASFGGAGVWRMLSDYPKMFTAAMLAAAYPLKNIKTKQVAKTPLCVVLGENDNRSGVEKVEPTVKEVEAQKGSNVRYKVIDGADHYQACNEAFTKENLDWVFQQTAPHK